MAKTKAELLKEAQASGAVSQDVTEDDFTAAELERVVNPDAAPAWEGSLSSTKPIVAPDGHVVLSQEDIDNAAA